MGKGLERFLGCAPRFLFSSFWTCEMGGGWEFLWDHRSGISKANSRSGLVCLLGEVSFGFCDNMLRDVTAELLFSGLMISKRSSIGS